MSRIRDLSRNILCNAKYVSLNSDKAQSFAHACEDAEITIPTWDYEGFYPKADDFEEICLFYLVFNAINYCYFDREGNKFSDNGLRGSSLMTTRLAQRWEEIRDPYFLSNLDENYVLSELLPAENPIFLVRERVAALQEVGKFLNSNPDFTFDKYFRRFKKNAYYASQALPTFFPLWRDPFFKRSQLFVGMVYGRFQNWADLPISADSLQDLTVFADYRIPQTLSSVGIISYAPELAEDLKNGKFVDSGSRKELEIRAASVLAADLITENLKKIVDDDINSLHTDYILWSAGHHKEDFPVGTWQEQHHFCITTDY